MLVAKFPGSIYAIEAITAGPPKASAVRKPPGPPASVAMVRLTVRAVSDDRSGASSIAEAPAVISCRIVSSGASEALTPKCSTSYRIGIDVLWVNGSLCSQGYTLPRHRCYDRKLQDPNGYSTQTMGKLPAEGTQARRFGKTRSAQSTALHEDYVELIADLIAGEGEARPTDIARRLGVSHATAIKAIARLKRAGLATARPYRGVFLTEKGRALAERVRLRHRLVVDVLRALGVSSEAAEADAEGIAHYVSEHTLKAFAQFLKSR